MLDTAEEFGDNSAISFAAMQLSYVHVEKRDTFRATQYANCAVEKATTPADKAWAKSSLAAAWIKSGEIAKGIQILTRTVQSYEAANWMYGILKCNTYLGEGYWLKGRVDEAKQTLEEVLELARRYRFRFHNVLVHRILGELLLVAHIDQASDHFKKSIAMAKEIKAENELALSYARYGRYFRQKGEMIQARKYLTVALDILERLGTLVEPDKIRAELSILAQV